MKLFDHDTQQVVEVPDDQLTAALSSGRYTAPQDARVNLINPDTGAVQSFASADIYDALSGGYSVETQAQKVERQTQAKYGEGLGAEAAAFGLGAARGLTLGLSDLLATGAADAVGGEEARAAVAMALREYRERNPLASGGGEVVFAVAPALLSGGAGAAGTLGRIGTAARLTPAGAVARAGLATERAAAGVLGSGAKSAAGKIVQSLVPLGAGSAIEGAAYGGAAAISEAALGDADLTAEQLLTQIGIGGLVGAGAGGAVGLGGLAAKGAIRAAQRGTRATADSVVRLYERATGKKASPKLAKMWAMRTGAVDDAARPTSGTTEWRGVGTDEAADEAWASPTLGKRGPTRQRAAPDADAPAAAAPEPAPGGGAPSERVRPESARREASPAAGATPPREPPPPPRAPPPGDAPEPDDEWFLSRIFDEKVQEEWVPMASTASGVPESSLRPFVGSGSAERRARAVQPESVLDDAAEAMRQDYDAILEAEPYLREGLLGAGKLRNVDKVVKTGNEDIVAASAMQQIDEVAGALNMMREAGGEQFVQAGIPKLMRSVDGHRSRVQAIIAGPDVVAGRGKNARVFLELDSLKRDIGGEATKFDNLSSASKTRAAWNTADELRSADGGGLYHTLQRHLESEELYGGGAVLQRAINPRWVERLQFKNYRKGSTFTVRMGKDGFEHRYRANDDRMRTFVHKDLSLDVKTNDYIYLRNEVEKTAELAKQALKDYTDLPPAQTAAYETIVAKSKSFLTKMEDTRETALAMAQLREMESMAAARGLFGPAAGAFAGYMLGDEPGAVVGAGLGTLIRPGQAIRQLAALERTSKEVRAKWGDSIRRAIGIMGPSTGTRTARAAVDAADEIRRATGAATEGIRASTTEAAEGIGRTAGAAVGGIRESAEAATGGISDAAAAAAAGIRESTEAAAAGIHKSTTAAAEGIHKSTRAAAQGIGRTVSAAARGTARRAAKATVESGKTVGIGEGYEALREPVKRARRVVAPVTVKSVQFALDAKEEKDRTKAYMRRLDELAEMKGNPDAAWATMRDRLLPLEDVAPQTAQAVAERAAKAYAFLYDKAPKPPPSANGIVKRRWKPSNADVARWERYLRAAEDPLSVLDHLRQGTLSREEVETLRTVYPKMYDAIAQELRENLGELQTDLPRESRVQLSLFFGVPVDATMEPGFTRIVQQGHRQAAAQERQAQQGQRPRRRPKPSEMPQKHQTTAQRLEAR